MYGTKGNAVKVKPIVLYTNLKLIIRNIRKKKHNKHLGTRESKDRDDPIETPEQI